jgi:SAM-dependent methyltransferase
MEQHKCLLCGNESFFRREQKGYQQPQVFKIFQCSTCNTSFSIPRVDASAIYELIYKNPNLVPGYSDYANLQREISQSINPLEYLVKTNRCYWAAATEIKRISAEMNSKPKILEIGSGLGYFTFALKNAGFDIVGLDISENAVEKAKEMFGIYYVCAELSKYALQNAGLYDIVVLTEVIEHIDMPLEFMSHIKGLLKTDGSIILTTPNKSFFPNEVAWYTDYPPVHCWWFSEESMRFIASNLKMKVRFTSFKDYHKLFPHINKIAGIDSDGEYFFDKDGKPVRIVNNSSKHSFKNAIKKNETYIKLRNSILPFFFPHKFKTAKKQSTYLCCVLN